MRESFVVHAEYLLDIPEDEKLKFYGYILEYGIFGIVPKVTGFEKKAWNVIQRRIEDDTVKYQKSTIQKRINSINFKIKNNTATDKDKEKLSDLTAELVNLGDSLKDSEIFQNILNNSHTGVSVPVSDTVSLPVSLSVSVSDTVPVSDSESVVVVVSDDKKKTTATTAFSKPSFNEVEDFIKEKNLNVNAEYFYNFYESSDWELVTNWKKCLLSWDKNEKKDNVRIEETKNDKWWEKK